MAQLFSEGDERWRLVNWEGIASGVKVGTSKKTEVNKRDIERHRRLDVCSKTV